jgi:hypothetical protein
MARRIAHCRRSRCDASNRNSVGDANYDLFGNNCEHFARFVASGTKESKQLQVVVLLGAAAVAMWGISNLNNAGTT